MVLVNIFFNLALVCFGTCFLFMLAGWFGVWRKHPIAPACFEVMLDSAYTGIGFAALALFGLLFI